MPLLAPSLATVLVAGETGTGKELVARHIHELSRPGRPFLAVNCGAIAPSLLESELFGHEKGAFTGALTAKAGWFEAAEGGTLFLDEIGELPLAAQVKLLRVIREHEVVRLGSRRSTPIDVRLVAATNVRLEDAVTSGHFRADLFYRIHVATIALPPLRERPGDILPLALHFLGVYGRKLQSGPVVLTADAERRLLEHPWPGNIRELENVLHHALLVCHGARVTASDLRLTPLVPLRQSGFAERAVAKAGEALEGALLELFERHPPELFALVEKTLMQAAYRYCEQNQLETARLLGVSRNVVRARLIQYGELHGSLRGPSRDEKPSRDHGRLRDDPRVVPLRVPARR